MNLDQANFLIQILSTAALVVSLIYLALQTRQTARNQVAAAAARAGG